MLYQTYFSMLFCLQFTTDVVGQLNSVKIDLRGIILLESEGKQNLQDFSDAGLSEINYADYLEEVKQTHTENGNILGWANLYEHTRRAHKPTKKE